METPILFQVITTFPEMITGIFQQGIVGSAIKAGIIKLSVINPRDFTTDPHRTVDDRPYGGGDGMVMLAEPLEKALMSLKDRGHVIYLSPQGRQWSDTLARRYSKLEFHPCLRPNLAAEHGKATAVVTLICGRYAGVDERFLQSFVAEEISVGDYVLSGGEIAAAILIDSIARHVPGTLGNHESALQESFAGGLLEGPSWTRPAEYQGRGVPEILTSGNHMKIRAWREAVSWVLTFVRRSDLLNGAQKKVRESLDVLSEQDFAALELGSKKEFLASIENQESPRAGTPSGPPLSIGLVHWPVVDKSNHVVCTNVTNLDIHDIARSARVYGVTKYFIINPQKPQLAFVERILDHWRTGEGSRYNEMRRTALLPVQTAETMAHACKNWVETLSANSKTRRLVSGGPDQILRVGTSAKPQRSDKTVTFQELRQLLKSNDGPLFEKGYGNRPILLLFGTGFGLAPEAESEMDLWLEPIKGEDRHDYRHLSVRSAVSICLDRLFGTW